MAEDEKSLLYKEKAAHGTPDFPFGFYEVFPEYHWKGISHHWHEELEIIYITEGSGELKINMRATPVEPGAFYFVNSGELHSLSAGAPFRESAILFHPRMLCFDSYDICQSGLLLPLRKGELSLPFSVLPGHPAYCTLKSEYLAIISAYKNCPGQVSSDIPAQLDIKAGLLKILSLLTSHGLLESSAAADSYKTRLLKTVLSYIRSHYPEKIYIRDLAGLVNMNEQYFCRFFKSAIGQSPVAYLNEYRIRRAFSLLLDSDLPVTDVCLQCGFNNFGNFLREFKKYSGTTPARYRKARRPV